MNNNSGDSLDPAMEKDQSNIKSIGLEFGPNFFSTYFFSDFTGDTFHSCTQKPRAASLAVEKLSHTEITPLYGLVHTPYWTLIPDAVFDESVASRFLQFSTGAGPDIPVRFEKIVGTDSVIVYNTDEIAEKYTDVHFPGLGLRHAAGSLIELTNRIQRFSQSPAIYVHQIGILYKILVFQKGKLILANHVESAHKEDIRYFVLYTMNQLEISADVAICLLGDAAENPDLAKALGTHLSQIVKPENPFAREYSKSVNSEYEATHFIGLNAPICA